MRSESSSERPPQRPTWSRRLLGRLAGARGGEVMSSSQDYEDFQIPYREKGIPPYNAHILRGPKGMIWNVQLLPRDYFDLTIVTERSPRPSVDDYYRHIFVPYLGDPLEYRSFMKSPVHVLYHPVDRRVGDNTYSVISTFGHEFGRDTVDFARPVGVLGNKLFRIALLSERIGETAPEPNDDQTVAIETGILDTMKPEQKDEALDLARLVEAYHFATLLRSTDTPDL